MHYVMPSYVDGKLRVLTPGFEYPDFTRTGLAQKVKLPVDAQLLQAAGHQPKGPKVRHNQWRYADYDGDGRARPDRGHRGLELLRLGRRLECRGQVDERPAARLRLCLPQHRRSATYADPVQGRSRTASPSIPSAAPRRTSRTSTATAISICSAASSSTASPTSRTPAPAPHRVYAAGQRLTDAAGQRRRRWTWR